MGRWDDSEYSHYVWNQREESVYKFGHESDIVFFITIISVMKYMKLL